MFNPDVFFKFESEELRSKALDCPAGNCGLTQDMQNFQALESHLQFGNGASERLIFSEVQYTDEEN